MRVSEGENYPTGYRPVWFDPVKREYVCFLIGIHWIMRKLFRLWIWSRQYTLSDLEIKQNRAYKQGYTDGQRDGDFATMAEYQRGFLEGSKANENTTPEV